MLQPVFARTVRSYKLRRGAGAATALSAKSIRDLQRLYERNGARASLGGPCTSEAGRFVRATSGVSGAFCGRFPSVTALRRAGRRLVSNLLAAGAVSS